MTLLANKRGERPIGLGLVGLGWGARVAEAVAGLEEVQLAAGFARSAETRRDFTARFGIRTHPTWEELVDDPALAGVIVMTPNSTHRALTIAALSAGKHVLVTKPIATRSEDAVEMIAAARRAGRILMVGHQSRRHPAIREMRRLLDAGTVGRIRVIEGNTSSPTGLDLAAQNWRRNESECPGGPLLQLGIHYIDNFQYLAGPITGVAAAFVHDVAAPTNPATTASVFRFASGATGYLGSSYVTAPARWIRVAGEAGVLQFHADGRLTLQRATEASENCVFQPPADRETVLRTMLAAEVREFADCIRNGSAPEIEGETGARNLRVVLAAVESDARGGQWVNIA